MGSKALIGLICLSILAAYPPAVLSQDAQEKIVVHVGIFKAVPAEDALPKEPAIYLPSEHPELASVGAKVGGAAPELKAALVETLLDLLNLETLDGMGLFEKPWAAKGAALTWRISDRGIGFVLRCAPRWVAPGRLALKATLLASKEGPASTAASPDDELHRILEITRDERGLKKLFDREEILDRNALCVMAVPWKGVLYITTLAWMVAPLETTGKVEDAGRTAAASDKAVLGTPKPTRQVLPAYPMDLRRRGITGVVRLKLTIDPKGRVIGVVVVQSVHPILDYAATQALLQWTFEPFEKNGKPVTVSTMLALEFNPVKYASIERTEIENRSESVPAGASFPAGLGSILRDCAGYCEKLENAALFFVCEENIREIHSYFVAGGKSHQIKEETGGWGRDRNNVRIYQGAWSTYRVIDPERTDKNSYLCDYQLVRKEGRIQERRMILSRNGRDLRDRKNYLEDTHYSALMPIFAAIGLLSAERQAEFYYRQVADDKTEAGREAFVIEAVPRNPTAASVERARIWVAKKGFQILRIETDGVPLSGYDDIFKDGAALLVKPEARITHFYQTEKNGIMFPSRVKVEVRYPTQSPEVFVTKLKVDLSYDRYKFFTVETGHEIIN